MFTETFRILLSTAINCIVIKTKPKLVDVFPLYYSASRHIASPSAEPASRRPKGPARLPYANTRTPKIDHNPSPGGIYFIFGGIKCE